MRQCQCFLAYSYKSSAGLGACTSKRFKSAKSIVKIRFVKEQPKTAWNIAAPQEYGFYANVNPEVDHPRWSQASERRIGEDSFFTRKRKTLMFNGYSEVASLYAGMDLKKLF